ncbi:MAG: hypothetical protein L7H04_07275 [Vulcanisaeta sp.]|nr:hypothetical protein [Vulcanisaeta sp.]
MLLVDWPLMHGKEISEDAVGDFMGLDIEGVVIYVIENTPTKLLSFIQALREYANYLVVLYTGAVTQSRNAIPIDIRYMVSLRNNVELNVKIDTPIGSYPIIDMEIMRYEEKYANYWLYHDVIYKQPLAQVF